MENKKKTKTPYTKARRKEWKKTAKHVLKTHYVLLIMVSLLAGFIGVEGGYNFTKNNLSSAKTITVTDETKAKNVAGEIYDQYAGNSTGKNVAKTVQGLNSGEAEQTAVFEALLRGDIIGGMKIAQQQERKYTSQPVTKDIVGRQKGILAGIANGFSSGAIVVKMASGLDSLLNSKRVAGAFAIFIVLLAYFLIWFFLINPYRVIQARVYLEARTYEVVPIGHLLFLRTIRKWKTAAKAIFRTRLYQILWAFTIIGGIIKYYSYWCVPYILAENPGLTGKEAILLSRKMMDGHKWETFKYDCTFIGWIMLSALTFGLLNMLFVTPYKRSTDAQLYAYIREESQKNKVDGIGQLKDIFLFEKTDPEVLEIKYSDILYRKKMAEQAEIKLHGIRYFCTKYLGLWIGRREEQLLYDAVDIEEANIARAELCAQARAYPERYNPLWSDAAEKHLSDKGSYLKSYSIWSLIVMFALFAFVGWAWEVGIHLVQDGVFINRGVQHGPWLPIYGSGAVAILMLLNRFRKNPAALAGASVVLCGFIEYFTSYILELTKGIRWWDYTGYFLNLNGRICAEGLVVFALAGMAAVYLLAPGIDRWVRKINIKVLIPLCLVFAIVFCADTVYSHYYPNMGEGITDYSSYQEAEQ